MEPAQEKRLRFAAPRLTRQRAHLFTGQHFQTATLQVSSAKNAILFTLQLRDVLVTDIKHGFSIGGHGPNDDVLMETITLDAAIFAFTTGDTTVSCSQVTNSCQ